MIVSFKSLRFDIVCISVAILLMLYIACTTAIPLLEEYTFYNNSEQVYGVVNSIEKYTKSAAKGYVTKYNFYVSYETPDGKKYDNIKAEYNNANEDYYKKGDRILIVYDKNNPTKIGVDTYSADGADIVMILVTAVTVWAIITLIKWGIKFGRSKALIKNGIKGVAEITNVISKGTGRYRTYTIYYVLNNPLSANNTHSVATGKTKAPSAKRLFVNQRLDVYFDPKNPGVYCLSI